MSINNAGGHTLTPALTTSAMHQIHLTNLLQQSPHQQNGHLHSQQPLTAYTINNDVNKDNSNNGHFIGTQVTTSNNTTDDTQNGTNGQEILAKLMHVTKREKRMGTRNGRVSSVIYFFNIKIFF